MKHWLTVIGCSLAAMSLAGCKPESPAYSASAPPTTTSNREVPEAETPVAEPKAVPPEVATQDPPTIPKATPTRSNEIERISFEDLNCNMQPNVVFRDWMLTERAKELDGKRVRLAGYILADLQVKGIEEFVLVKNLECKFGPDGQADHLAMVFMLPGETVTYTSQAIDIIGTLHFKPFTGVDGNTWAIYEIEGESVQPMKR